MELQDWVQIHNHILELEVNGVVTRTFRRLDPSRQHSVLNAILDEAIEHGPSKANIKRIASRAGLSVGSLYNYFPDRDSLMAFAVELCTRYMTDAFDSFKPFLLSVPLREAFEAYLLGGLEWSRTQTNLVRFFLRAAYGGDSYLQETLVLPIAQAMLDLIKAMLSQAQQRGEIREDLDVEANARVIHAWTLAIGDSQLLPYLNTYMLVTDQEVNSKRALSAMLDTLLNGIGPTKEVGHR
jgi:AcrR family transcriptional regulator